jgi:hypothetical protein
MIPQMEGSRPPSTPEEYVEFFEYLDRTFPRGGASPKPPVESRRPDISPEEVQQRLSELFPGMASRPELPKPPPEPPPKLTPEEIQQQLNEAFAGVLSNGGTQPTPEPRVEIPRPQLSPEELQQRLDELFGDSPPRSAPTLSPRRLRSLFRVGNPGTVGPSRRERCDARVKNLFKIAKNGVRVTRGVFCKGWAMGNGRCWVHGGASTGPRTPEGKARVVAAMVEGRRKWVARRRAQGKQFPAGRKCGERWVTEPMRELARAEAHRLKGGRFTLDRALTLALLRSANGCLESRARAKAMLDAQERAEIERDRQAALARVRELRGSLLTNP